MRSASLARSSVRLNFEYLTLPSSDSSSEVSGTTGFSTIFSSPASVGIDAPALGTSMPTDAGDEKIVENPVVPETSEEESEEGRVKYSKFKRTLDRAKEAERMAEFYREQALS